MNFLKRVLSTVVGIFLFFILCFFFLIFIGIALGSSSKETVKIKDNSVLTLHLDFPVLDNAGDVQFKDFPFVSQQNKDGLFDLVNAIDYAATDPKIKGISIEDPVTRAGITQLKTLREAIDRFKSSGKFVRAYANVFSQTGYYLSSVADSVYLNPSGIMDFRGLATELLYFKDLQDKSGVKFEVIRMGKYKSAVEPYLQNEISEANKEQVGSYLNSIWKNLREEIGMSRNIAPEKLDSIADLLLARTPEKAQATGLIDKVGFFDQYESAIREEMGLGEDDDIHKISLAEYTKGTSTQRQSKKQKNKIAVIYAQGQIYDSKGSVERIAPDQMNRAIRKATRDNNIKAIVLRVNSPGGSALASDMIWRELENAKKEKPVVVSMGDLAASGGYYISTGADYIFAEPTTITGSIGVFGLLPNFKGLTDKIGVNAQQVTTNKNAIAYSPFTDLTEDQRAYILESISRIYDTFKTRVSEGRNLTMGEVEEIAQGRVWTGEQALEKGLVDKMGGLSDALTYAAEQAGIDGYQTVSYPKFKIDVSKLLKEYGFGLDAKTEVIKEILGEELYPVYLEVKNSADYKGRELLFPYSRFIH